MPRSATDAPDIPWVLPRRSDRPSPLNDAKENHDDRDDEQQVDETTDVKCQEAECPKDDEYHSQGVKHESIPRSQESMPPKGNSRTDAGPVWPVHKRVLTCAYLRRRDNFVDRAERNGLVNDQGEAARFAAALHIQLSGLKVPLSPATRTTVYAGVCEYVDAVKAMGWPPERVIVAVKRIAADAGVQSSTRMMLTGGALTDRDQLLVDLVGWCIERYYADVLA